MNKKLAISGHATRGKEVIEIFLMLGGKNIHNLKGIDDEYYYIDNDGFIDSELDDIENWEEKFTLFTLEGFLGKFPYKVGDKVLLEGVVKTIKQVCWNNTENEVIYKIETNVRGFSEEYYVHHYDLQPYKMEVTKEFYNKYCVNCGSQRCTAEGEWLEECRHYKEETMEEIKINIPKGYEFDGVDDDNQQVIFTKIHPKYPKTFKECCEVLSLGENGKLYTKGYKASLIQDFHKLLICRDAYWKIAGEQMGLDEPWKPDWDDENEFKYGLYHFRNGIMRDGSCINSTLLAFPTEEMRDAFYENFKELINKCKELL